MAEEKKRPGRKPKPEALKKKAHQIYATDPEWQQIEVLAEKAGEEVSPYIIKTILSK